jgi:hypothetical protein
LDLAWHRCSVPDIWVAPFRFWRAGFQHCSSAPLGGAASTQERYSQAGSRGCCRSRRETNDAQLFAQSARAADRTDERSQHLYCQDNLTSITPLS